jgi:hypothetical protein
VDRYETRVGERDEDRVVLGRCALRDRDRVPLPAARDA